MRINSGLVLASVTGLGALPFRVSAFLPGVGSDAFLPNLGLDIAAPRTISHADQTSQAIIGFLEEHFGSNASFGFPTGLFRRRLPAGVRSARKAIIAANEGVDQAFSYNFERFHEKDYGPAHFDDEYLEEGQNHLLKLRSEMIAILLSDQTYAGTNAGGLPFPVEKARVWLGRQLHTLQDFYAHSNWVEMGKTTISPVVGRPGAVMYPKTPLNEPTCTEYCINPDSLNAAVRALYFGMQSCYRSCFVGDQNNREVAIGRACAVACPEPDYFCLLSDECKGQACSNNTIEIERVRTGYYRTNSDPNSIKPSGKCSHGGLSDAGAKGIEGINKDSTLETYSPHWFLHRTAANLAIEHSRQYLADLLEDWPNVAIGNVTYPQPKLSERHIRLLFGLNPGSMAFVIDRSRSMATSLPAVKGAIRAVVTRLQNMGYLPFQWVLVGYGQSFDTTVTVTSDINVFLRALDSLAVDTTNSCLQERYWEGLVHAARNSLERSQVFVFTDQPASNLPNPGTAYNQALSSFNQETRELERTRLFGIHVLELPNDTGYPYFEHPWQECGLSPEGTRRQEMGFLRTFVGGHGMQLGPQSRANMVLEISTIIIDIIFENSNTAATEYRDRVYDTNNRQATDAATREIVVDSTVDFIKIFPSDRGQDGSIDGDVKVERPDGTIVKPLEDSDVVHVKYRDSGGDYVQLIIPDPQPGTWKFTRMAPSTYMLADVASAISFSFDFVEWEAAGAHAGWITKPGGYLFYPFTWSSRGPKVVTVKARVDGPVGSVDAFHLRTKDSGAIIMAMNLTRVDSFRGGNEDGNDGLGSDYVLDQERIYMGFLNTSTFPFCGDFFATVSGTDADGIPFTRRDPGYIESSGFSPNWGRPRSAGCPPIAVPPILVDISTFPSTSTSTTSSISSAIIAAPLTSSTSFSASSDSSSISSFASSSALSRASSTSGSLSATSSTTIIPSENISSDIDSTTEPSSSVKFSTLVPVSSSKSALSSSSAGGISSQTSSASESWSTMSSEVQTTPSSAPQPSSSFEVMISQISSASESWSTTRSEVQTTPGSVPTSFSSSDEPTTGLNSGHSSGFVSMITTPSSLRASSSAISSASGTSIITSATISSDSQSSVGSEAVSESSDIPVGSLGTITATVISSLLVSSQSSSIRSAWVLSGTTAPIVSDSTSTTLPSRSASFSTSGVDSSSTSADLSSEHASSTSSASTRDDGQSAPSSSSFSGMSGSSSSAISITDFATSTTAFPVSTSPSSSKTRTKGTCRLSPAKMKRLKRARALRKREKIAKPTGRRGQRVEKDPNVVQM